MAAATTRTRRRPLAALVLLLGIALVLAGAGPARVQASGGQPSFGVYTPDEPGGGIAAVNDLAAELGRPIDVVLWYQLWSGDWAWEQAWISSVLASGRQPLLTWEPWDGNAANPAYSLAQVAGGAYDGYVTQFAQMLAGVAGTVYLRPFHEMNGNWYPWGGTVNGNSPADFVRAWRHLHDIFAQAGATNVKWVWAPNASDWPATSGNAFELYYPGSDYVDVLGLDGYNFGTSTPDHTWQTFVQVFASAYDRITRLGPQPVWITETASAPEGGDKAQWIRDMFAALPAYPRIAAVVWFNMQKERDWRADATTATTAAFNLAAAQPPAPAPTTQPASPPPTTQTTTTTTQTTASHPPASTASQPATQQQQQQQQATPSASANTAAPARTTTPPHKRTAKTARTIASVAGQTYRQVARTRRATAYRPPLSAFLRIR